MERKAKSAVRRKKLGDCYDVHGRMIIDAEDGVLCHGTVWHPQTGWHRHCWIERTDTFVAGNNVLNMIICHDESNGNRVDLPQDLYYRAGQIKDVHRYTREQACELMLKHKHFGPWE